MSPRSHTPLGRRSSALLLACACAGACGCATGTRTTRDPGSEGDAAVREAAGRFFAADSFWNRPVAGAALDPRSPALVAALVARERAELGAPAGPQPTIDTTSYSTPVYTVGATQQPVTITLSGRPRASLQAAWRAVPLPGDARPAAGTDGDAIVWQPSRERMWEFWRLHRTSGRWSASWGGAIRDLSASPGYYNRSAWPGATRWWGVTASSLALAGGLITFDDLSRGQISHALAMSIPEPRAGVYALPAQRTDGTSSSPLALPEGAHLRLDPGLDLAGLRLPRMTLLLAQAAQRYGIYIRDRSPNIGLYAQDPTALRSDPYTAPGGYFEGLTPTQIMAAFPWSHLQLLRMRLRTGERAVR